MNICELTNQRVKHINLGEGTVTSANVNILVVRFDSGKETKFSYPSAFRKFLSVDDENLSNEISNDLQKWLVVSGTLVSEELQRKTELRQKGINDREAQRQIQRIERAKADAQRGKFLAGLDRVPVQVDKSK